MKLKRPQPERPRRPKTAEVLAEPEPEHEERPFNPERDISETDWRVMKSRLNQFRSEKKWNVFGALAIDMKILFPHRVPELMLDESTWNEMKVDWDAIRTTKEIRAQTFPMYMKLLFPERATELDLKNNEWLRMKKSLESNRAAKGWAGMLNIALTMSILFPNRMKELELENDWPTLKQNLGHPRSLPNAFPEMAMALKLLFPDQAEELRFDQSIWDAMKKNLEDSRKFNAWSSFSNQAMAMTILAADRAEITSDGQIKLTQKPKPLAARRPLPERPHV